MAKINIIQCSEETRVSLLVTAVRLYSVRLYSVKASEVRNFRSIWLQSMSAIESNRRWTYVSIGPFGPGESLQQLYFENQSGIMW